MQLAPHELRDEEASKVVSVRFNDSQTCFASATTEGWHVYRSFPLETLVRHDIPNGSFGIVYPVAKSNIVLLVGGPPTPAFAENKVVIWDDATGQIVAELEFDDKVRGLAARRDRLAVALRRRVVVFVLGQGPNGLWREGTYETYDNPLGLVVVATASGSTLLAFPGRQAGHVALVRLPRLSSADPLPPKPSHDPLKAPYPAYSILVAHTSVLAALTCSASGTVLATCSSKGTLVRLWDTRSSQPLQELRRGTDQAIVWSLALRDDAQAIAVTSDKGTVHIWDLTTTDTSRTATAAQPQQQQQSVPSHSSLDDKLAILKPYLPKYFSSSWSHSQFRLPAPETTTPSRLPYSYSATKAAQGRPILTVEDDVAVAAWIKCPRKVQSTNTKGKGRANEEAITSTETETEEEDQVVVVTQSGSWYRIALGKSPLDESNSPGKPGYGLSKDSTRECRLEEYRRFNKTDW